MKKFKTIGIIIGVVVVLFVGYVYFLGGDGEEQGLLVSEQVVTQGAAASELLAVLRQLEEVRIDTTFFSEPAFRALQDFSVQLAPEPRGRENPFAPLTLGVDGGI